MTIITSQKELEQHLKEAREDITQWRVYHSFDKMMESIDLKAKNTKICIK